MAPSDRLLAAGWTAAVIGAGLAASPYLLARLAVDPRWRRGFGERLGGWPPGVVDGLPPHGWYWVHAASVGEVRMALRLAAALEAGPAGAPVRITAFTPAGRATARQGRPGSCYAPLDLPWIAARRAGALPRAHVAVETELWPNLLLALHRRGIPAFVVSAKLSAGSFARYRRFGALARAAVGALAGVMARDAESAERFVALGCDPSTVRVTGDLKLDVPPPAPATPPVRFPDRSSVLLAASVHPGEEGPLLDFFADVARRRPSFTLILAPRHLERVPWFVDRLRQWRLPVLLHSRAGEAGGDASGRVYLVDTLGDLPGLYHLAGAVFVGGTLIPVGGHNLMEPAQAGRGVLFGPHRASVAGAADLLLAEGGGIGVDDGDALMAALGGLFDDGARLEALAAGARRAAARGAGAIDRTVAAIRSAEAAR